MRAGGKAKAGTGGKYRPRTAGRRRRGDRSNQEAEEKGSGTPVPEADANKTPAKQRPASSSMRAS